MTTMVTTTAMAAVTATIPITMFLASEFRSARAGVARDTQITAIRTERQKLFWGACPPYATGTDWCRGRCHFLAAVLGSIFLLILGNADMVRSPRVFTRTIF